jgi:hypothetical protein
MSAESTKVGMLLAAEAIDLWRRDFYQYCELRIARVEHAS